MRRTFTIRLPFRRLILDAPSLDDIVPPHRALHHIKDAVHEQITLGRQLVSWYRREKVWWSLRDDRELLQQLYMDIGSGMISVREERIDDTRTRMPSRAPSQAPTHQPRPREPAKLEPIVDSDKSVIITDCPAIFDPRKGPLRVKYQARALAGQLLLRIRSQAKLDPPVHARALEADQTTDGQHQLEWDGVDERTGELVERSAAPFVVELVHDDVYRDSAKTALPPPARVTILQFEDLSFATDRSILLPTTHRAAEDGEAHPRDAVGGLDVIAAALAFVDRHPHKLALVAGHTDTAGSSAHNLKLSEDRANTVHAYLTGDRGRWADACQASYEIADFKAIHRWAALELGWNTDPGELDNEWTTQAREARDEFRVRCNEELGVDLERHVKQNKADWEAIFALYDQALMRRLDCDAEALAELRARLVFLEPATLGCGEHWPVEAIGLDDHALAENRRVELLFFDPGEEPQLPGDPPGQAIYGRGDYLPEYLPADPSSFEGSREYEVWVELRNHWVHETLAFTDYSLRGPIPTCPHQRQGTTDGHGRLREGELAPGDYIVEVGDSFAVVGARYAAICYVDDRPDVYRLPGYGAQNDPGSQQLYEQSWRVLTSTSPGDFADGLEDEVDDDDALDESA